MPNFEKSINVTTAVPTNIVLPVKYLQNDRIKDLLIECGEASKKFPIQVQVYRRYVIEGTEKENVTILAGMLKNIKIKETSLVADILVTNRILFDAISSNNFAIDKYVVVAQTHYDRETDTNTVIRFILMQEADYEAMQAARAERAATRQKKDFKGKFNNNNTTKKPFINKQRR